MRSGLGAPAGPPLCPGAVRGRVERAWIMPITGRPSPGGRCRWPTSTSTGSTTTPRALAALAGGGRCGWRPSRCAVWRCCGGPWPARPTFRGLMSYSIAGGGASVPLWVRRRAGGVPLRPEGRAADRGRAVPRGQEPVPHGRLRGARGPGGRGGPGGRRGGPASASTSTSRPTTGCSTSGPDAHRCAAAAQAVALARAILARPRLRLEGLMGYEAQLAGVPDQVPGARACSAIVRLLKRDSGRRLFRRRQEAVAPGAGPGARAPLRQRRRHRQPGRQPAPTAASPS